MLAPKSITWNKRADIVVIGYGMAGATTAIAARDLGAAVIILEKQAKESHCSFSSISGGGFICPDDIDGAIRHMEALSEVHEGAHFTDSDIIVAWAKYASQNCDWLSKLGGHYKPLAGSAEYTHLPGAESIKRYRYNGCGLRLMRLMYDQVASRKAEVLYRTQAQRLLTNADGEVIGVKATDAGGKELNVKASKAVVLCTGGFEDNEEMKLQYLRTFPLYFAGGNANTGDGINMAQEVGAALWHMNCCSARLCAKFPDFPIAFLINFGLVAGGTDKIAAAGGFIIVNRYGQRYMTENLKGHAAWYEMTRFDTHKLEYPAVPSYDIFDHKRMAAGPLIQETSGPAGPQRLYNWSRDNRKELERGWIISAGTLGELTSKLRMSSGNLERTVRQWNKHCEAGKDAEFGRNPRELIPIDTPPYYGIQLFPGGLNTQGGPRRNARSQVVNPFGEPIPGLYVVGECGSVYGMLYPGGGGNLAECIAFGRIAAENAVKEKEKV